MKKVLLSALLATMTSLQILAADDYAYSFLVLTTNTGQQTSLPVEGLRLTVNGTNLVATQASGTQTFDLSSLASMRFSSGTATVVEQTAITHTTVEVFSLAGMRIGEFANMAECRSKLGKGIYIITQAGKTKKLQVK